MSRPERPERAAVDGDRGAGEEAPAQAREEGDGCESRSTRRGAGDRVGSLGGEELAGEGCEEDEEGADEEDTEGADEEDAEEEGEEGGTRQARAPWHFKVIVVGSVVYLGYRLYQGLSWLAHHI